MKHDTYKQMLRLLAEKYRKMEIKATLGYSDQSAWGIPTWESTPPDEDVPWGKR